MIVFYIVLALLLGYLLFIWPTQWLKVERIEHYSGFGIKILQISDLHVEKLRIRPEKLREVIQKEAPDYIALTGDFTQRSKYLAKVQTYAEEIASCGIPVLAVLGNHDHRLKSDLKELIQLLEKAGITVLMNRSIERDGIQFVGIDDYGSKKSNITEAFQGVDANKPMIVLSHNPNVIYSIPQTYQYLLSGHFHGMQFRIPFLYKFLRKGKLANQGKFKGLHPSQFGSFYISKGIGQSGVNARFLIRSEVTVHEFI